MAGSCMSNKIKTIFRFLLKHAQRSVTNGVHLSEERGRGEQAAQSCGFCRVQELNPLLLTPKPLRSQVWFVHNSQLSHPWPRMHACVINFHACRIAFAHVYMLKLVGQHVNSRTSAATLQHDCVCTYVCIRMYVFHPKVLIRTPMPFNSYFGAIWRSNCCLGLAWARTSRNYYKALSGKLTRFVQNSRLKSGGILTG